MAHALPLNLQMRMLQPKFLAPPLQFKPLKVHFIGEEGIDAGGVKKARLLRD